MVARLHLVVHSKSVRIKVKSAVENSLKCVLLKYTVRRSEKSAANDAL